MVGGIPKFHNISSIVLEQLHWLPSRECILLKTGFCAILSYWLHPSLLKRILCPNFHCPWPQFLQSVAHVDLVVPATRTATAQRRGCWPCLMEQGIPQEVLLVPSGSFSLSSFLFWKCLKTTLFPSSSGTLGWEPPLLISLPWSDAL